jgi:septal ring factor EnvC (AmiA/AmiB activator)
MTDSQQSTYRWKSKEELLAEIALLEQRLGDSEESLYELRASASTNKMKNRKDGNFPLKRAEDRLRQNKDRLFDAIHRLQEGFSLFYSDDKLVVFNN